MIEYFFRLLGAVPPSYARKLSGLLGSLLFLLDKRHRTIAIRNLSLAFGQEKSTAEIAELAEQVFVNLATILFEIGQYLRIQPCDFEKYFRTEGIEHLSAAHSKGKGVLAILAHIGNWELLPVIAAMANLPLRILYRPLDFSPLDEFFVNLRTRFGATMIPKANSMRKILKCLGEGDVIALLMDQNVDWYEGVFADFFGHPACTSKGLALLALKTESPVIPAFLVRDSSGFVAEFGPEIPLIRTGDKIKDVEENTRQYNKAIEDFVRRFPDQWFWVHQRWKTKHYCPSPPK